MKKISNILFGLAIIFGAYGGAQIIYNRINLPQNVCPIDNNRIYLYIAIACVVISVILEMIVKKRK